MDIYKEINEGIGYAVCPIENIKLFKKLRDSFVDNMKISSNSKKNIDSERCALAGRLVPVRRECLCVYIVHLCASKFCAYVCRLVRLSICMGGACVQFGGNEHQ